MIHLHSLLSKQAAATSCLASPRHETTMKSIGKFMQLAGLAVPPLAIISQLTEAISLGQMLTFLVASVCLFGIGRIIEGFGNAA